jgi:biopolymer transport protein ExbD
MSRRLLCTSLPSHRRLSPPAQIQITPLIDVLLVLLVLGALMWARGRSSQAATAPAPFPQLSALPLTLPAQSAPAPASTAPTENDALIGLGTHGQLSWQGRPVTRDLLMRQLQAELARDPATPVWLAIDATTPYAEVVHWLDWLQARQVLHVNLLTTRPASAMPAPEAPRKP